MKGLFSRKSFIAIIAVIMVLGSILAMTIPVAAATTAIVTVTNTTQYLAITVSPITYNFNATGAAHPGVLINTTYYSNPGANQITSPTVGGALSTECAFTITNTSSVATDLTVTASNMSGGSDNSTNANSATAGATSYGCQTYFTGQASGSWVVCKSAGSSVGDSNLAAVTDINMGLIVAEQTNAWTGSTAATFTVTITTAAH
jgi:hypothetical protein